MMAERRKYQQPADHKTNYHCSTLTREVLPEDAAALTRVVRNLCDGHEPRRAYTDPRWCRHVPCYVACVLPYKKTNQMH
jgi:hypothetical protein